VTTNGLKQDESALGWAQLYSCFGGEFNGGWGWKEGGIVRVRVSNH